MNKGAGVLDGNGIYRIVRTCAERTMNTYVEEITCVVFVVRLGVYCSGFTGFFLESEVSATHSMRVADPTRAASGSL